MLGNLPCLAILFEISGYTMMVRAVRSWKTTWRVRTLKDAPLDPKSRGPDQGAGPLNICLHYRGVLSEQMAINRAPLFSLCTQYAGGHYLEDTQIHLGNNKKQTKQQKLNKTMLQQGKGDNWYW